MTGGFGDIADLEFVDGDLATRYWTEGRDLGFNRWMQQIG